MENLMPVIWVIVAIVLLLFMTVKMKVHSMIALLLIAIFVAFMEGMDTVSLVKTITKGAGSTLGGVGLIIVLGAALGQLMTDCGASKKLQIQSLLIAGQEPCGGALCLLVLFSVFPCSLKSVSWLLFPWL